MLKALNELGKMDEINHLGSISIVKWNRHEASGSNGCGARWGVGESAWFSAIKSEWIIKRELREKKRGVIREKDIKNKRRSEQAKQREWQQRRKRDGSGERQQNESLKGRTRQSFFTFLALRTPSPAPYLPSPPTSSSFHWARHTSMYVCVSTTVSLF